MNILTNKKSSDVFENFIKIDRKKSNEEQHIGMQLIWIDVYRLLIPCFHLMTSFKYVMQQFPKSSPELLYLYPSSVRLTIPHYVVLVFWTSSQCYVGEFLYMDQNMVFPSSTHNDLFSFERLELAVVKCLLS